MKEYEEQTMVIMQKSPVFKPRFMSMLDEMIEAGILA